MNSKNIGLEAYVTNLQKQGKYFFLREDAVEAMGGHARYQAFRQAAARLRKKGRIAHVRSSFYIIIPIEYRSLGLLPVSWFIDALMNYLSQDYYVALLSAAALHGASHQQVMVFQVITNKQTKSIKIGNYCIEFLVKKQFTALAYEQHKVPTGAMQVATIEMTAYDLLRYLPASGYLNHVATVLLELADNLDVKKMQLLLEHNLTTIPAAQRLGYLLDALQVPIELEVLKQILAGKNMRYIVLDPHAFRGGVEKNSHWKLLLNCKVEPDEL